MTTAIDRPIAPANLKTPLCDLLGVDVPIMLAGMGGVAFASLAAAVSEAGGLGVLGMAGRTTADIADQMREVRRLTDRPFGVDLLAATPEALMEAVDTIISGGASLFAAGLGVPAAAFERFQAAGVKVLAVCGSMRHARKAQAAGCDLVVAQGAEAGGHTGEIGAMPFVAQAAAELHIPVVAAGGIYDGRGLAASLALGAQGAWIGTRFIASFEAHAGCPYKQSILSAQIEDTVRTRAYTGKPMRVLKNAFSQSWEGREAEIAPFPLQALRSLEAGVLGGVAGQIENLDPDRSCFAMGQSAGGVHALMPAGEIVREIASEARATIERLARLAGL